MGVVAERGRVVVRIYPSHVSRLRRLGMMMEVGVLELFGLPEKSRRPRSPAYYYATLPVPWSGCLITSGGRA
jgi:hypothetical protein